MSAGFNFNDITLRSTANIEDLMENFEKIEEEGIKAEDATRLVTTTQDGWMSKEDKGKLNGIQNGAQANNINTVKLNNIIQQIVDGILALVETDPTVPDWAKAQNKPTYDWSEIGSKPTFVTQSVVTNFWYGTQAEYDAIITKNSSTLYLIQEEVD